MIHRFRPLIANLAAAAPAAPVSLAVALLGTALLVPAAVGQDQDPATQPATRPAIPGYPEDVPADLPRQNELVLETAYSYPPGGGYRRDWGGGTGTPDELRHDDQVILARDEGGTYCCGYTLAIVMRVMNELGLLEGRSYDEVKRFQKLWYGSTAEDRERLVSYAVEDLGVGQEVPEDEALPGDFLQFWRTNKSGHSVVFLGWLTDDQDRRIGVRYHSSQGSTDGIGDHSERFAEHGGKVDPERLYFARLNPPADSDGEDAPGSRN